MDTLPVPPSGQQFEIRDGDQQATIVEVGGAVRRYDVDGIDVLEPFAVDAMSDGARGLPLIPWPNRLRDGRFSWDGDEHQLPLTEPSTGNAIHGLLGWRSWACAAHEPTRVTMQTRLLPSPGFPFALQVDVDYALSAHGLTVTTTATNIGATACPFGSGHHPYLSTGGGPLDDCVVEARAATRLVTDERRLPCGVEAVAGTSFDLSGPEPFGDRRIDHAFGDLERDDTGRATLRMTRPDGRVTELWMDHRYRYLQLYTGDTLHPARRRRGLAVEPMTCPPDAFRSGVDVVRLEPGEAYATSWGVAFAGER